MCWELSYDLLSSQHLVKHFPYLVFKLPHLANMSTELLPTKRSKSHCLELVGSNVKKVAMPSYQWCWDLEVDFANS
jgi:hypothetical protein